MYASLFEMSSWAGVEQYIINGNSVAELLYGFEDIQSLSCLVKMGKSRENGDALLSLVKLEQILNARDVGTLTVDKLLELDVKISLGSFKCVEVLEGNDAHEKLRAKYPNAK
jgi:hypothetical protein